MLDDAVRTELPADLTAPAVARHFVAEHAHGLPSEMVHDAELLVSELVTNAVRYGAPPIAVSVSVAREGIAVAVDDHGPGVPAITEPPPGTEDGGGRGLHIVAAVAREWGVNRHSSGGDFGKQVWFRVGR